ncbi:MAG: hypothetical protein HPY69_01955 [Armatimonadetes bacterium]|nr:hypothetical protein [Armatimonadota bacterium]
MCAWSGRAGIAALVAVAAVVGGTLALRPAAVAWNDSAAVRLALGPVLAALSQDPVADFPELAGREPTTEEKTAISAQVAAYVEALHARQYPQAWAMTAPETREPWELDEWEAYFAGLRGGTNDGDEDAELYGEAYDGDTMALLLGHEARLAEVLTWGDAGVCRIVVEDEMPAMLALVHTDQGWRVDLHGTDDAQARLVVHRQLSTLARTTTMQGFLQGMMMTQEDAVPPSYLDLLVVPAGKLDYRIAACRIEGNRALVAILGRRELHLRVPLANGDQGWSIAWCRGCRVMQPNEKLTTPSPEELAARDWRISCASNLKQLALAMLMYCQDYDQKMPIADRWCGATYPYIRNNAIHHCPADDGFPFSYAMNYKLSRQPMSRVMAPAETVMLFESSLHRANAYDRDGYPGDSLAVPPRHGRVNNYAYVDGHVIAHPPEAMGRDFYRLQPERYAGMPYPPVGTPPTGPGGSPALPGHAPGSPPMPLHLRHHWTEP